MRSARLRRYWPSKSAQSDGLEPSTDGPSSDCCSWPCQGLLTTASKTNGSYAYNFATVPLLAELLKLLISSALLQRQRKHSPEAARVTRNWRTSALFLVPSLIYWLHNNVQFVTLRCASSSCQHSSTPSDPVVDCSQSSSCMHCQSMVQLRRYVDPATYQIMGNLKIVTTGLLLWACLRRQLSLLQWLALALLMIGATTSQVPHLSCILTCRLGASAWGQQGTWQAGFEKQWNPRMSSFP